MSNRRQMIVEHIATLCHPAPIAVAKRLAANAISDLELYLQESEASEATLRGHLAAAAAEIGVLCLDIQVARKDAKDAQAYIRRLSTHNVDLKADNAELADSYNSKRRSLDALQLAYGKLERQCARERMQAEDDHTDLQSTIATLVSLREAARRG